jgi:hypothetical protein
MPPTQTATLTPAPGNIYFFPDCIPAWEKYWILYPYGQETTSSGRCLKLNDFFPEPGGVRVERQTSSESGEQQRGIYALLQKEAIISFAVTIDELTTSNTRQKSNLAFGVTNLNEGIFNYFEGAYLYYFTSTGGKSLYQVIESPEQKIHCSKFLRLGQTQNVKFAMQRNTVEVFVEDMAQSCATITLAPGERAFYLGYDLFANTTLNAVVSDFSLLTP